MRYAENTQVASDRSRAEIEKILQRYGAITFSYGMSTEDLYLIRIRNIGTEGWFQDRSLAGNDFF